MNEVDELLDIVDNDNNVITQATRGQVYNEGLLHRAVNVFIFNSAGKIYLQQRSQKKKKYPLAWDLSTAEHLKPEETFEKAAYRGINEELGINTSLKKIRSIHRQDAGYQNDKDVVLDNELVETYKGIYDGKIKLDPAEVNDGRFFSISEIKEMIKHKEFEFTSWFIDEWNFLLPQIAG